MEVNTNEPLVLDLFCGVGGSAMGYSNAGFRVVGVDYKPQRNYPFEFVHADVFEVFADLLATYKPQVIHASPPCKAYSTMNKGAFGWWFKGNLEQLPATRLLLQDWVTAGEPLAESSSPAEPGRRLWVIENVVGAPLKKPLMLCGSMFNLGIENRGYLQRHRIFESNAMLSAPGPCMHDVMRERYGPAIGVYGHGAGGGHFANRTANAEEARVLMEMPWAPRNGVTQAIPPAYTEWIGNQLMQKL